MKLIAENEMGNLSLIKEEVDTDGKKSLFIEGIFAQAEKQNRNKRVYPKKILEKSISDYVNNYVSKNRALGELNHPSCYLYDTFKVFTPNGWVDFKNINVNDDVFCMDENGNMVVGKVENKIQQQVLNETSYHIKGRHIDSIVTSEHRFYCLDRNDNIVIKTAEELYENSSHLRIIKNFKNFKTDKDSTIVINGIKNIDSSRYSVNINEDLVLNAKEFCKFLGFWLAEGWLSPKKYNVLVCQRPSQEIEDYKSVLKELNISFNVYKKENDGYVTEVVSFADRRIHDYLAPLGKCYTKYIPENIKSLPKECLIELLNWFAKGDGRKVTNGSDKRKEQPLNIFSTSKKLIEDFNEIVLKCGFAGKIHEYNAEKDYIFAGRLIEAENKHTLYQLNISCVSGIHLDRRFISIEKEELNSAYVYCLTTTYDNFYIEDKGNQYLTGNCPTPNPERACILIKELKWDGNDVIGKAKVLSTPQGEIVKSLLNDGVQLGVSTRGLGSLTEKDGLSIVENDYAISAIDVVSNPSGIDCWVNGILENTEYYYDKGVLMESTIEEYQNHIKKCSINTIKEDFNKFIKNLII